MILARAVDEEGIIRVGFFEYFKLSDVYMIGSIDSEYNIAYVVDKETLEYSLDDGKFWYKEDYFKAHTIKSCNTCDRRIGYGEYARCGYSGYFCITERKHNNECGQNYEHGWVQRRPFYKRLLGIKK